MEVSDVFKILSLLAALKHQVTEDYPDAHVVELCVMMYFRMLKVTLIQKVTVALLWTAVKGFPDSSSISWRSLSPPITSDQMALTAVRKELYCNLKTSCATSGDTLSRNYWYVKGRYGEGYLAQHRRQAESADSKQMENWKKQLIMKI